jgi:alpha-mannosidase
MGGGGELRSDYSYPLFAKQPVGIPKTSILKERIELLYKSGQYDKVNLLAYVLVPSFHDLLGPSFTEP